MKKRILCISLSLILILCMLPISATASERLQQDISAINKTRYTDYLVIYTSAYGSNTRTNIYGTEAVVTNGTVTFVGGNSNDIPVGSNCFVISGHGTMSDWVKNNVTVGMSASYDAATMKLTLIKDENTLLYRANDAKKQVEAARNTALDACLIYDTRADEIYQSASKRLASLTSPTEAQIDELVEEFNLAAMLYTERESVESRGVWLRPTQKSKAQVEQYVKKCVEAGINMICIETMYAGTMIYPTPKGSYFKQNPVFNTFDVLGAFVEICHKYGIELHCWMPVFYSCNTSNANWSISVAAQKPEWQSLSCTGSNLYAYESSGMVFLNPANDEVQDFLIETYTYLLKTYDIDGFQLDYIRYRDRYDVDDFGYDQATFAKFKEQYPQYKNSTITFDTKASYWNDWVKFRADQVSLFVKRMRDLIDAVAPGVVLSADVGVSQDTSYSTLYQDSKTWLQNGWLDMIHPMAYGSGYTPYIEKFVNQAGDDCLVIPGLGIFMDEFDGDDMAYQAYEMSQTGCNGVVYFQTEQYFSKNADDVLLDTLYTQSALAPLRDKKASVTALLERTIERVAEAEGGAEIGLLCKDALALAKTSAYRAEEALEEIYGKLGELKNESLRTRAERDIRLALYVAKRDGMTLYENLGDVNLDGKINEYDYILVARAILGTYTLDEIEKVAADVDRNGIINEYDYILIARHHFGTYVIK